jgi:cytochrome c-type biogenesis protein CcmH
VRPWRFAALAALLALLLLVAAQLDGARLDQAALPPALPGAGDGDPVPALVPALEAHLERTPRDGRGWMLLARQHFAADRFEDAARAYERALAASRKVAQDPQVWCELADALAMAQGGRLAGRPRELIDKALALRGTHPRALEMAGSAAYEARDYERALFYWQTLLAQLDPPSRAHRELRAAVERLQQRTEMAQFETEARGATAR